MTNLRLTEELRAAYDPAVIDSVEDQVRLIDEGMELAAEARAKLADRKARQAKGKHWLVSLVVGDMVKGGGSVLPPNPRLARNLRRGFYATGRRAGRGRVGVAGVDYGGRHTLLRFPSLHAVFVDWMLLDATVDHATSYIVLDVTPGFYGCVGRFFSRILQDFVSGWVGMSWVSWYTPFIFY